MKPLHAFASLCAAALTITLLPGGDALAQYPVKPLRIVVA